MSINKSEPIAILGSGAWGLSTALHLLNAGHTDITVYEQASEIPSKYSAAYDLNKIVRAEYEDEFYTQLALEAINQWQTPLWGPYFHRVGYVLATTGSAPQKARDHISKALLSIKDHPAFKNGIVPLNSGEDFRKPYWQFTGPLSGFQGYFNRHAGYAHSANAMKGIQVHVAARGVKFVLGPQQGKVTQLLYSGSPRKCTGFKTADGKTHSAALTITCLGAYAASLIPELAHFIVAKCWSVAHVQLTEQECDYLRGIPVLNVRDLGFFFEADPATRLFKLCPLGAGFINTVDKKTGLTLPPSANKNASELAPGSAVDIDALPAPLDYIPRSDELKLRRLLRETLPWMADRPFVDQKMCWFSDTADSEYCVDFVPDTANSLMVLSGDSGHGFKMMPIVGRWVVDLLRDGKQELGRWRFKERKEESGEDAKNWGDEVSWRIGRTMEISEVVEERERVVKARL